MSGAENKQNNRRTGAEAENRAARYLEEHGLRILERNFCSRKGEIDLIGNHEGYLVFVEVKYRSTDRKGAPEAAVGTAKQRRICGTADYYRFLHGLGEFTPVRYDVVAVKGQEIIWYKNAFPHIRTRG